MNNMKNDSSLDLMIREIKNKYPEILDLIVKKDKNFIEFELENDVFKTFEEQSKILEPILKPNTTLPIQKIDVKFNEKHNYFKLIANLR